MAADAPAARRRAAATRCDDGDAGTPGAAGKEEEWASSTEHAYLWQVEVWLSRLAVWM